MACITMNPSRAESIYPELSDWIDRNSLTLNEFGELVGAGRGAIGTMLRGRATCSIHILAEICKFTHLIFIVDSKGTHFVKSSDIRFTDANIISKNSESNQPVLDAWMNTRGLNHSNFESIANVDHVSFSNIYKNKIRHVANNIMKICTVTGLSWVIDETSTTKCGMFRLIEKLESEPVDILEPLVSDMDKIKEQESVKELSGSYDWYSEEDDDMNTDVEEVKEPVAEEPKPDDISLLVTDSIAEAVNKILAEVEAKKPVIYSLDDYQKDAARTIPTPNEPGAMKNHALFGLCSEVGELHGLYQKLYQGHKFDKDHAKKELGDILWMVAEYATAMGWSLEDVAKTNIEKLQKRYPDGFDSDKSLHREEGDV